MDLCALVLTAVGYGLNQLWLRRVTTGAVHLFLVCWGNDILAGVFMLAWLNLLLGLGRLGRVTRLRWAVPFLLVCALVWEAAAPAVKPEAVFDPWDFAAYQTGGLIYLSAHWLRTCRQRSASAA